jgi:hypothetical protein
MSLRKKNCQHSYLNNKLILPKNQGNATASNIDSSCKMECSKSGNSRPMPFALSKEVQEQVEEILADHIIEESYSSYVNPLTLVQRDGKRVRTCLDAREANKFMTPDRATVPPVQMLL